MFRILVFLFLLGLTTLGLGALLEQPGTLSLTWFGYHVDTSPMVGLSLVALAAIVLWSMIRFIFSLPGVVSITARARKRARGHDALARGIVAAGVGDLRKAKKACLDAQKFLPHEPLTLLLEAQTAQLSGDRAGTARAFRAMAERPETQLLGLRGLHAESLRQGDQEEAHRIAVQAQAIAPLAWSGQAVLDHYAAQDDWDAARLCVSQNLRAKVVDAPTGKRQKAVLDTAQAMDCELTDPQRAIGLLRAAVKKAPDLIPATALLGRLLSRKGEMRAGSKLIEAAFAATPHPDLAQAYIDMRPGDSAADRLSRAKTLAKCAPNHPESAMLVASAALGARDFAAAREAMAPLIYGGERPTARMCVIMAELEEREHDAQGLVREWLARGSRAPRDATWVADGHFSKQWAPVSPVTGKLDAYRWMQPHEELSGPIEAPPPAFQPPAPLAVEAPQTVEAEVESEPAPAPAEAGPPAAEILPPEAKTQARAEARKPAAPQPVIFPMPSAPDDPGPKRAQEETRLY